METIVDKTALTQEEIMMAERFHNLIDRNMNNYHKWWIPKRAGMDTSVREDLNNKIFEQAHSITVNAARVIGYYGLSIFHQLVSHNYYEAVELLLKKGVNPDVRGAEGKGNYVECHVGITPLQLACYGDNYRMAKLLIDYGADTTLCDDKGRNCFHFLASAQYSYVCGYGDSRSEELIEQRGKIAGLLKCDINKQDVDGITPLMRLMQNKYKEHSMFLTKKYIEYGANVSIADNNGNTALMYAAQNDHNTATAILADYKELVNRQNNEGETALHKAFTEYNHVAGYILVEAGANINIKNNVGECVADIINSQEDDYYWRIVRKCMYKKTLEFDDYFEIIDRIASDWWGGEYDDCSDFVHKVVRKLLKTVDRDDDTELVYVIKFLKEFLSRRDESCAALQLLEEEGYDLCAPICEGSRVTTLRDICVNVAWDDSRILPKLKEMNVDLDEAFADGCTPANIIAGKGIPNRLDDNDIHERIAGLFDYFSKASMERLNNEGKAAIHLAAEKNSYLVLKKMIERGVNPELTTDAPCQAGNTPLHIACMRNNIESVQELLEAGADDSLVNQDEETPAHCLFSDYRSFNSEKSRNIMAMLNSIDTPKAGTGETPFILMLKKDSVYVKEFTALMLEKGVDVNRADNRGNTPLLIHARKHCDRDVVKLMLNAGADINARDEEGNSVLHYVLKNGNCELARLLIKKGADYNVANHEGQTPVNIAVEKGYDVVLELMTDI